MINPIGALRFRVLTHFATSPEVFDHPPQFGCVTLILATERDGAVCRDGDNVDCIRQRAVLIVRRLHLNFFYVPPKLNNHATSCGKLINTFSK